MNLTPQLIFIVTAILAVLVLILGYLLFDLRRKFLRLFSSEVPESQAVVLTGLLQQSQITQKEISLLKSRADVLEQIGQISFQRVGFMRFNPFADTGGDQSFALALLDHNNNGIVISSLYNREGTRVYAKAIDHGNPKQQLSAEEEEVLQRAMSKS